MVNFEDTNAEDPKDLLGKLHQITLPYDSNEVLKWIKRLEVKMETYGVASQWSKRIVFENNLPDHINNELSEFLLKSKDEAGATIYKEMKALFIKNHGPDPEEMVRKAQNLVMTGTPSQTARQLSQMVCQKTKKLEGCCCAVTVAAKWRDLLPDQVRAQVAGMTLDKDSFENTLRKADNVYKDLKLGATAAPVAAIRGQGDVSPASGASAHVDAVSGQRSAKKKDKGKAKPKRRDPADPTTWGKPHPDGPPPGACMHHFVYGKSAYFCSREKCPWNSTTKPPKFD